jgi:phage tail P2-like protein
MKLNEVNLLELQSAYMKRDPTIRALCAALTPKLLELSSEAYMCLIYANIDNLDESILNGLAWQWHIEFYDESLTIEKKRQLVKNAIRWHRLKGTPAAVEELTSVAFDESRVEEWFDYDGDPYNFRIVTTDRVTEPEKLQKLSEAINTVKNARSHLEGFFIERNNNLDLYFAGVVQIGKTYTLST